MDSKKRHHEDDTDISKKPRLEDNPTHDDDSHSTSSERAFVRGTPLHHAIENWESIQAIERLIDKRSDLEVPNEDGLTPLFRACQVGNFAAALQLLQAGVKTDLPKGSQEHDPLLHFAVRSRDSFEEDCHTIHVERPGPIETRDAEQVAFVKALLERGFDVNEVVLRNEDRGIAKCIPLNTAIDGVIRGNENAIPVPSVVKALLEAGADPNHANERRVTPLVTVIDYCVEDGCDLEITRESWDIIRLLVEHGARLDAKGNGDSALSIAAEAAQDFLRDSDPYRLFRFLLRNCSPENTSPAAFKRAKEVH